jgi:type IV pilus assembly protein PilA
MANFKKGFTLIELLVVIAIIGILSSVVLASLNTARSKGADAAVKSNLNNIRAQAEIVYDNNGSYALVCADTNVAKGQAAAVAAGGNGGVCSNASGTWTAWAGLKGTATDAWCVDNTGTSKQITKPTGAITVCP